MATRAQNELHQHLWHLRSLGDGPEPEPVFQRKEDAELAAACLGAEEGQRYVAIARWHIDYDDLIKSRIIGWSTQVAAD